MKKNSLKEPKDQFRGIGLILLFLLIACFCLTQQDVPLFQETSTELNRKSEPYVRLELHNGDIIDQTFVAPKMKLTKIDLYFYTSENTKNTQVKISLRTEDGTFLAEKEADLSEVLNAEAYTWILDTPVQLQENKNWTLHLEVKQTEDLALMLSTQGVGPGVGLAKNQEIIEGGNICFQAIGKGLNQRLLLRTLIAILGIVFLVLVGTKLLKKRGVRTLEDFLNENSRLLFRTDKRRQYVLFGALLGILTFAVYWQYILGIRYFIFRDAANDSYAQTVPILLNAARNFWEEGILPGYNLLVGLGANEGWHDPFTLLMIGFGEKAIPYLLGLFQAGKVILAGVIFYAFLQKWGANWVACTLGALGYAFSGTMMLRSGWASYPNEVVCIAIMLLALEYFLRNGNSFGIAPAFALFIMCTDLLRICIYFVIFIGYAAFRFALNARKNDWRVWLKFFSPIIGTLLMGICLAAPFLIPQLNVFSAERTEQSLQRGTSEIGWINDISLTMKILLRFISNDILGTGNISTAQEYLDDPAFYFGLCNLLMVPQIFLGSSRKKKIFYGGALGCVGLYLLCPKLRYLMNGMSKESFKFTSAWIIVVMLFLAAIAWKRFFQHRYISKPLLVATAGSIYAVVIAAQLAGVVRVPFCTFVILLFVGVETIVLIRLYDNTNQTLKLALVALFSIEIICTAYSTQNVRTTVTPDVTGTYLEMQRINGLKAQMDERNDEPYRVDYEKADICASLAQNYLSLSSYVGGSGISDQYKKLMNEVAGTTPLNVVFTPYFTWGYKTMRSIDTLFGVKYLIQNKEQGYSSYLPYGYSWLENKDYWIAENGYSLPLAFTYDSILSKSDFLRLSKEDRREVLLQSAVVEDESSLLQSGLRVTSTLEAPLSELREKQALPYIAYAAQTERGEPAVEIHLQGQTEKMYLVLHARIYAKELSAFDQNEMVIGWRGENESFTPEKTLRYIMNSGDDVILLELPAQDISCIRIESGSNIAAIEVISVSAVGEEYFTSYRENVAARKANEFCFTKLRNNIIEGNISIKEQQLLCFSLNGMAGWKAKINGENVPIYTINETMMGLQLSIGENYIQLIYQDPRITVGIVISFITLLVWWACFILYRKKRKV